ncbi:methylation-associated defense system restriction endonuclease subunit S MAD5 [Mucilaginibacter lacusdianchii]|uniref:methylation-associated defense system restriction endonuclease subunit S MAD5 n=1 Tax=Mucilaginibacter lacusdianchii TaxID=2684211 RepID=UPI00131EB342|nr:restriction endonuclease subunit S [Mucilaginibacter sp. JXJ CY 39]
MKVIQVSSNWVIKTGVRLDASFHLSDGVSTRRILEHTCPYRLTTLSAESFELFKGNIHKRVYVQSKDFGHIFYSASDLFKLELESGKYVSKKHSPHLAELELRANWILITRSGTLGKVFYTTANHDGKIGTDDLVRINPAEKEIKRGYLYAFLASRYGYGLITQSSYGGVVKHIEPHHIKDIPIPILPESKQKLINDLIIKSSNLRVEANVLIKDAVTSLESALPTVIFDKIYITNIKSRTAHNSRLEATFNTNSIQKFYDEVAKNGIPTYTIKELSKEVFTPGIFKRIRTEKAENGIPFFSGSDLLSHYPVSENHLSRKMKNISNYILKEGWIAIQDAGTIGYVSYITDFLDGVSATNNLVRIVPNARKNYNEYIFCFLKTSVGQKLLKTLEFGSVQKHIDNNQISNFCVPVIESLFEEITEKVKASMNKLSEACFLEQDAIQQVETEIESWQES